MGTKTLIRLSIALVALGAVAALIHFTGTGGGVMEVTSSTSKTKVFSDFPINDIASVVVTEKEGSVTLRKGEKTWEVVERDGYAANSEPIISLLRKIWDLNIVQPISIGREQYGRLGLADPEDSASAEEAPAVLTFQNSAGEDLATLWLGKVYERSENRPDPFGGGMAMADAGRYVKRGDSNAVYLVGETFSEIKTEASEWLDKSFFRVEKLKSIEILSEEKANDWKLERSEENGDFTLAKAGKDEKLDQAKVSSMKSAFSNPQVEDVLTGDAIEENKADKVTFKLVTFDDFQYEISLGEKNDLNELPLTLTVSAKFPKERKVGEEESDEEKKRLDKEFEDRITSLKDKLEKEQALAGHLYKVRSYIVDSITKKRSELLEEKPEVPEAEEVAPGVSLPGLPPQKGPAVVEPAVVEPAVVEPAVVEPAVKEPEQKDPAPEQN